MVARRIEVRGNRNRRRQVNAELRWMERALQSRQIVLASRIFQSYRTGQKPGPDQLESA
jgi:hypothetical protein